MIELEQAAVRGRVFKVSEQGLETADAGAAGPPKAAWGNAAEALKVGEGRRKAGDLAGAADVFLAADALFPEAEDRYRHPLFVKEAFRTLLELGALEKAVKIRDDWEARKGPANWSRILLARHLARVGTKEQAVAAWRAALEVEPAHREGLAYIEANAPPPPPAAAAKSDLVPRMSAAELKLLLTTSRNRRRIIEFGCGGSTLALARNGAERIDSVESDKAWVDRLKEVPEIAELVSAGRVILHHVDVGPVGPWGTPTDSRAMRRWPAYWMDIWQSPDSKGTSLVLVDGRFRVACALAACLFSDDDCLIALHDYADRPSYHVVLDFLSPIAAAETLTVFTKRRDVETGNLLHALLRHAFNPA